MLQRIGPTPDGQWQTFKDHSPVFAGIADRCMPTADRAVFAAASTRRQFTTACAVPLPPRSPKHIDHTLDTRRTSFIYQRCLAFDTRPAARLLLSHGPGPSDQTAATVTERRQIQMLEHGNHCLIGPLLLAGMLLDGGQIAELVWHMAVLRWLWTPKLRRIGLALLYRNRNLGNSIPALAERNPARSRGRGRGRYRNRNRNRDRKRPMAFGHEKLDVYRAAIATVG